ncbi:hypothetical protein V6N13_110871 [Hibiscus sabdariffa]
MGFSGPNFTWERGSTYARLDRYICWQLHDDFRNMLLENWKPSESLSKNIRSFSIATEDWNRNVFGFIGVKKHNLMARLRGVQRALCTRHSHFLLQLEDNLLLELETLFDQEELLWR